VVDNYVANNYVANNYVADNHVVENYIIENNGHHAGDFEDLIDLEHFLSYENDIIPSHATVNDDFPDDWLTNTAETDILYSVNPYL